ncbi:MAG: fatty acid metabolism transcriptional regulator FadR [Desulfobacterium sp.]|nr:fatty acid metabolism transcriptional regulator FadR [Desulfobacterium sp.]
MKQENEQPMKPQQFAEYRLLTSILNNTYPPESKLPNERVLAEQIGVTRPTLRETLQRLSREKWLNIQHGKQTVVNDYWNEGGLGMLATMAKYAEFLPSDFISNLLDFRIHLLPPCAAASVRNAPERFLDHLEKTDQLGDDAEAFTIFDWELQILMVKYSKNLIYPLILNDFSEIYRKLGTLYFRLSKARKSSGQYYAFLKEDIENNGEKTEQIVRNVMRESLQIWQSMGSIKEEKK